MSNNLVNEISPYLLQHKNNPVDWYPWNQNSLAIAKTKNLPVLLSVGYSSCHWCHVMAHESFEDNETAMFMNKNFFNIKVDREERPDIDLLYQSSLSLMGQQGGWPLTMFLDSGLTPFWGGTYFPNKPRHGMPSFLHVLKHISNIYNTKKDMVINNANAVKLSLEKVFYDSKKSSYNADDVESSKIKVITMFDNQSGGLRGSPKFPMIPLLRSLSLMSVGRSEINSKIQKWLDRSLSSICLGGIYDHVGGGFSRYSTDEMWFAPHFEKMLYDNAQFLEMLSIFYSVYRNQLYKNRVEKTFLWLKSEMLQKDSSGHRYYSAVDADTNGSEGDYYVWEYEEIKSVLKENFDEFSKEYGVLKEGNWEGGKNILHRIKKYLPKNLDYELGKKNNGYIDSLFKKRLEKNKPFVDKKIMTDWNSMLVCGLVRSWQSFQKKEYLEEALSVYSYISNNLLIDGELYHSSKNGELGTKGNLDDYANFIKAGFLLNEANSLLDSKSDNFNFLEINKKLLDFVIFNFYDEKISDFYFSKKSEVGLFFKTKNIIDTSTQSGSSIMLENLLKAYVFMGELKYKKIINTVLENNWDRVSASPISHLGYVAAAYMETTCFQIVILAKNDTFKEKLEKNLLQYSSFFIINCVKSVDKIPKNSPAYNKKFVNNKTTVYVCSGTVCSEPISSFEKMEKWIEKNTNLSFK
tara:strand:- start:6295 stop:8367 length:2073 start_codon:yes stop_codon:yes gene_type:complete